jgi:hypothetical protein
MALGPQPVVADGRSSTKWQVTAGNRVMMNDQYRAGGTERTIILLVEITKRLLRPA